MEQTGAGDLRCSNVDPPDLVSVGVWTSFDPVLCVCFRNCLPLHVAEFIRAVALEGSPERDANGRIRGTRPPGTSCSGSKWKSALSRDVGGRSAWAPEPCVKHVSRQAVLSAGFPRFHGEFVHPLRVVGYVFTTAETINRQSDGFVKCPRLQFDRVLDALRVPERYAALLHAGKISKFAFYSPCLKPIGRLTACPFLLDGDRHNIRRAACNRNTNAYSPNTSQTRRQ